MSDSKTTVFTEKLKLNYKEEAPNINLEEFEKVIRSRRSVRIFDEQADVPDSVIEKALEHGLLAPNSSNLQPWEFHWVKEGALKDNLVKYCFSQNGAKTAKHLIVCVAKTNTWKRNCERMLAEFSKQDGPTPKVVEQYYKKIAPMAYGLMGPFGLISPLKWLLFNIMGLFNVMARKPIWPADLREWASKTTALACENIMLSLRAQGFDSLPMEGFDEYRVKKLLKLSRHDHVTMIIATGKRGEDGVYGPQFRFPKEDFIIKH